MDSIKVKRKEVADIINATFPAYTGCKFSIQFVTSVVMYDTNWGGGTKSDYAFVAIDGRTARFNAPAPWHNAVEGKEFAVTPEVLVVKHDIFCGHDMGITIYAHPIHQPKWLTQGEQS